MSKTINIGDTITLKSGVEAIVEDSNKYIIKVRDANGNCRTLDKEEYAQDLFGEYTNIEEYLKGNNIRYKHIKKVGEDVYEIYPEGEFNLLTSDPNIREREYKLYVNELNRLKDKIKSEYTGEYIFKSGYNSSKEEPTLRIVVKNNSYKDFEEEILIECKDEYFRNEIMRIFKEEGIECKPTYTSGYNCALKATCINSYQKEFVEDFVYNEDGICEIIK